MRFAAIAILFFATAAHAADEPLADYSGTYICKATGGAGLAYDKSSKTWSSTTFNVSDSTYTVKAASTGKTVEFHGLKTLSYKISVKKFGSEDKAEACSAINKTFDQPDRDEISAFSERMECRYFGTDYVFNFKTLRYIIKFEGSFIWADEAESHDTPYVEAGKCDKID